MANFDIKYGFLNLISSIIALFSNWLPRRAHRKQISPQGI